MPKALLTKEIVEKAIEISLPTIRNMVEVGGWGPKGVVILIDGPGLNEPFYYAMDELGPENEWVQKWGAHFGAIAHQKLAATETGMSSAEINAMEPWMITGIMSLHRGGVTKGKSGKLRGSASGAKGPTDVAIVELVLTAVALLCHLKRDRLYEAKAYTIQDA